MAKTLRLKSIKNKDDKSSGDYECSLCSERFRPNPNDPGEMAKTFNAHTATRHPGMKVHEDVNQAAARIIREATERD
jgi:hypothetical protein